MVEQERRERQRPAACCRAEAGIARAPTIGACRPLRSSACRSSSSQASGRRTSADRRRTARSSRVSRRARPRGRVVTMGDGEPTVRPCKVVGRLARLRSVRYPRCRCQRLPARASGRRRLRNGDVCRRGGRASSARQARSSRSSSPTRPTSARGATASSRARSRSSSGAGRDGRGVASGCATASLAAPGAIVVPSAYLAEIARAAGASSRQRIGVLAEPGAAAVDVRARVARRRARSSSSAGSHRQKALAVALAALARRAGRAS